MSSSKLLPPKSADHHKRYWRGLSFRAPLVPHRRHPHYDGSNTSILPGTTFAEIAVLRGRGTEMPIFRLSCKEGRLLACFRNVDCGYTLEPKKVSAQRFAGNFSPARVFRSRGMRSRARLIGSAKTARTHHR